MVVGIFSAAIILTADFGFVNTKANQTEPILYGADAVRNYALLFSHISKMKVGVNFASSEGENDSQLFSYVVTSNGSLSTGHPEFRVNLTDYEVSGNKSETESSLIWVDGSTGHVVRIQWGGEFSQGKDLDSDVGAIQFMTGAGILSLVNSTSVSPSSSPYTVSVGNVGLIATDYSGLASFTLFRNWSLTVGSVPQIGIELLVKSVSTSSLSGTRSVFRLLDLETSRTSGT